MRDGFGPPGVDWEDGTAYGAWRAIFNGYGKTRVRHLDGRFVLSERPLASTRAGETHASLVATAAEFGPEVDVRVSVRTVRQLRSPAPNPWEVGWLLWAYRDNLHFYYVSLKPNGWELGKEDPDYPGAQRFLATGAKSFPVGSWHRLRVRQVGNVITVWANGQRLVRYRDEERAYLQGSIGLYNEDARVHFSDVVVKVR